MTELRNSLEKTNFFSFFYFFYVEIDVYVFLLLLWTLRDELVKKCDKFLIPYEKVVNFFLLTYFFKDIRSFTISIFNLLLIFIFARRHKSEECTFQTAACGRKPTFFKSVSQSVSTYLLRMSKKGPLRIRNYVFVPCSLAFLKWKWIWVTS